MAAGRVVVYRFTIVELCVVLGTIVILMALLLPTLAQSRQEAKMGRWESFTRDQKVSRKMVLQYTMQEGPGASRLHNTAQGLDVASYEPEEHDGLIDGTAVWEPGRWYKKRGLLLDGRSGLIRTGPLRYIDAGSGEFTILMWIKLAPGTRPATLFDGATSTGAGVIAYIDRQQRLATRSGGHAQIGQSLASGAWTMIACVQGEGGLAIHAFSESGSSRHLFPDATYKSTQKAEEVVIGALNQQGSVFSEHFSGIVDEVAVFSRPLAPAELEEAYAIGRP